MKTFQRISVILLASVLAVCAFGQIATQPVTPAPADSTNTVAPDPGLPLYLTGDGLVWLRGNTYPLANETMFAKNFTTTDASTGNVVSSNWYFWVDTMTPFVKAPNPASPTPSTLGGGAWYIAARSSRVMLAFNIAGQVSATQSAGALGYNGNVGVMFKPVRKWNWWVMPYVGGSGLGSGATSGTFVMQPGVRILYGFGSKKKPAQTTTTSAK